MEANDVHANFRRVYVAFCNYQLQNGRPPTIRELASMTPYSSTSNVSHALQSLEKVGLLTKLKRNGKTYYSVTNAIWVPPLEYWAFALSLSPMGLV